jgi:hypothetical protein
VSACSAWLWSAKARLARRCVAAAVFGAALGTAAAAQREAPAHREASCADCHRKAVDAYAHAPMRNAMTIDAANPAEQQHPDLTLTQNGYTWSIRTQNGRSTYTVSDGTSSLTLPIRWSLGDRSQTFLVEKDGHLYESLVSFFHLTQSLAITPGDDQVAPHNVTEALGRPLPVWEVRNCFTCHASGYKPDQALDLQKLTPGLDCDRCHTGSAQHMADAVRGDFSSAPASLGDMNAGEVSTFCGRCHRTWDRVVRENWHGPPTVRFQPYRLANSRCYDSTDKRISCLACHDPHQPASQSEGFYDAKCLACHSTGARPVGLSKATARLCPVSTSGCVHCHMPKIDIAQQHAEYTDHQIRIVKPGEPYPD